MQSCAFVKSSLMTMLLLLGMTLRSSCLESGKGGWKRDDLIVIGYVWECDLTRELEEWINLKVVTFEEEEGCFRLRVEGIDSLRAD